jgi:hypothetical protein
MGDLMSSSAKKIPVITPAKSVTALSPVALALAAARANLRAGLDLQLFAAGLVATYFLHAPSRAILERFAALRVEAGWGLDMGTTAWFGAILPFAVLQIRGATRGRYNLAQMGVLTGFWACKGLELAFFYGLQAKLFGTGRDVFTIVGKTVFDQFVYCPLFAVPCTWLVYSFVEGLVWAGGVAPSGGDMGCVGADGGDYLFIAHRVAVAVAKRGAVFFHALDYVYDQTGSHRSLSRKV